MSLLFQIPKDISINVLSKLCKVDDLGRLDTASCSVNERSNLLKIFCSPGFDLHDDVTLRGMQFCTDKGMTMKSIVLYHRDFKLNRHRNIVVDRLNTQKITELRINRNSSYENSNEALLFCCQLVNRCNAVEKVMLDGCWSHVNMIVTSLNKSILHNLKMFSCVHSNLWIESYNYLAEHCKLLEVVRVEHNHTITPEVDIQSLLIGSGGSLKKISFNDRVTTIPGILTNKTLQCVIDHCPIIQQLILGYNNAVSVSLSLVNQLLTKCTALTDMKVGNEASKIALSHRTSKISIIAMRNPLIANEHELIEFFTQVKQINVMKLFFISSLSATTLNTIALHNSTSLEDLDILNCPLITTADALTLINELPKVTDFTVRSCSMVEKQVVEKFMDSRKRNHKK